MNAIEIEITVKSGVMVAAHGAYGNTTIVNADGWSDVPRAMKEALDCVLRHERGWDTDKLADPFRLKE